MARACCSSSHTFAAALLLLTAIPLAAIISLERIATGNPSTYEYRSLGWFRECAKWDGLHRRFLLSTFLDGGVSTITDDMGEKVVIKDPDVAGNGSLGIMVDVQRRRLMVTYADVVGRSYGAIAAYDLDTWQRIFLTRLSGPGDDKSFADDVAVDNDGNAYITDAQANKIWKVGLDGQLLSIIRSPSFKPKHQWYYNFVGLNGIVYHPNGYLLVIHTSTGFLFKVDVVKEEVKVVEVEGGSLVMGDGLELLSLTELVLAGTPSARVVESSDDWETGVVTRRYLGPVHRVATSATVKDGKVYLNHFFGGGIKKRTHVIVEAVFSSLNTK